ncbi:unnamed protein product, partial [Mesorhabditis spiculigera]
MGEANVFNTFSFNKWAEQKKEEEIDKETKRRRHEQIKRLKEKLRKERALREAGMGDGDFDLELLIQAIQNGQYEDVEETHITTEEKSTEERPMTAAAFRGDPTSDDYILSEVLRYTHDHPDGGNYRKPDRPLTANRDTEIDKFNYNRRLAELLDKDKV